MNICKVYSEIYFLILCDKLTDKYTCGKSQNIIVTQEKLDECWATNFATGDFSKNSMTEYSWRRQVCSKVNKLAVCWNLSMLLDAPN